MCIKLFVCFLRFVSSCRVDPFRGPYTNPSLLYKTLAFLYTKTLGFYTKPYGFVLLSIRIKN